MQYTLMFIHRHSCTSNFVRAFAMCMCSNWIQSRDPESKSTIVSFPRWNKFKLLFFENFESFSKSSCCAEAGGQSEKFKPEAPGQRARDSDLSQHLWWKFAVMLYYILYLSCGESATQPDQCNNPASPCQKVCRPFPDGAEMVTERERKSCNRPVFLSFQALSWAAQCVTSAPPFRPFVICPFISQITVLMSHFLSLLLCKLSGGKERTGSWRPTLGERGTRI